MPLLIYANYITPSKHIPQNRHGLMYLIQVQTSYKKNTYIALYYTTRQDERSDNDHTHKA